MVEDAGSNRAAYVPDLPGCVATGETEEEVSRLIREAIELHLEGMVEDGTSIVELRRVRRDPYLNLRDGWLGSAILHNPGTSATAQSFNGPWPPSRVSVAGV